MSCGLGAIILVFMLVKHNVDKSVFEAELLKTDLERLHVKETALRDQISAAEDRKAKTEDKIDALSKNVQRVKDALKAARKELVEAAKAKSALEDTIKTTEIPKKPDVVEAPRTGEEQYLIGLRVEGSRIAILVDGSASMTDDRLIDVIRRKNGTPAEKRAGEKWKRTKKIVTWLAARLPETAETRVTLFNNTAHRLGDAPWTSAEDGPALTGILAELDAFVPEGGTNLQAGLDALAGSGVTDIYLITDGLPTAGDAGYKSLNPFADCSALWGESARISGICRLKLFAHTVNGARLPGVTVNVIMLPIEGDPTAAHAYWKWAAKTRGIMISPAVGWP
tara:strand:- start:1933 stop:2943 length:1011 start_codon:yes stop_codon:yes gene_type:complete